MKRIIVALILAGLLALATAVPAFAIVDPATPIGCTGTSVPAKGASGGSAGGADSIGNPGFANAPGPVFPAKGGANAAVCP